MAHIEDRWFRDVRQNDGATHKEKTTRHGAGKRWRVRYLDPEGREHNRSFDRKIDADRFKVSVEADVQRGVYLDPDAGRLTLRPYAESWLAAQTFGESTRERTESRLRLHVYPQLGGRQLAELARSPSIIQAWIRGLQAKPVRKAPDTTMAPGTIGLILTNLTAIMAAAVDDGLISRNPCRTASVRAPKVEGRRIVPWSAERVAAVRAGLQDRYRAMADAGSGLGLRQGEVFGLSPGDVDWLRKNVHVCRQVKIIGGRPVFDLPKGGRERDVPLPESVALRLSAHLAAYPAVPLTLPWQKPGGRPETVPLAFTTRYQGALWRGDWNRISWHTALGSAGVTPCRENGFHALRHHFASLLLADGVDIRALAEYLGHADPGFTLRVYCHLMPASEQRMRQAIDRVLAGPADGPLTAREMGAVR